MGAITPTTYQVEPSGGVTVTDYASPQVTAPVNPDGTMNINLPEEYRSSVPSVALTKGDISTEPGAEPETEETGEETSGLSKYAPYLIGAALLYFVFMRRK